MCCRVFPTLGITARKTSRTSPTSSPHPAVINCSLQLGAHRAPTPHIVHRNEMNKPAKVKSARTKSSSIKSEKRPAKNAGSGLTSSGPSHPPQNSATAMGKHAAEQQRLAADVPFNATKAGEYGLKNALSPTEGAVQEMPSNTAGAGT